MLGVAAQASFPLATTITAGERFGAQDARRVGLARDVVPLADLEKAGPKVVKQLANGPEALAKNQGAGNGELVWHERR
jgi:enoyl-CoA hydratase/carnithine racemase